jgi:hypothetical protein
MLALAEILGLLILNAMIHAAFARWKLARRAGSRSKRTAKVRVVTHYPLHPSPVASALRFEGAPEHAAHIRPAGVDW